MRGRRHADAPADTPLAAARRPSGLPAEGRSTLAQAFPQPRFADVEPGIGLDRVRGDGVAQPELHRIEAHPPGGDIQVDLSRRVDLRRSLATKGAGRRRIRVDRATLIALGRHVIELHVALQHRARQVVAARHIGPDVVQRLGFPGQNVAGLVQGRADAGLAAGSHPGGGKGVGAVIVDAHRTVPSPRQFGDHRLQNNLCLVPPNEPPIGVLMMWISLAAQPSARATTARTACTP